MGKQNISTVQNEKANRYHPDITLSLEQIITNIHKIRLPPEIEKITEALIGIIHHQTQQILQLKQENDSIKRENAELKEEVKSLREQLNKDSHNSSKPPSSDGFKKKIKSLRKPSTRKGGR